MPSDKVSKILKSRTDFTLEEISLFSEKEAWNKVYELSSNRKSEKVKKNFQICFTGFGASKKIELTKLAEENNFDVVKSVTKTLYFLVGDGSSGPVKISKAKENGARFLSESDFIHFIKTGEIKADG